MVKVMEKPKVSAEDKRFLKKYEDKLARTTKSAKWISDPNDHEDHKGQTLATRNHEVIMRWARERDARPATVPGTEHDGHLGVLRFDFPGYEGAELQEVDWDEWFKAFDTRHLVMLFQEHLKKGTDSNFFRFDSPEREHA